MTKKHISRLLLVVSIVFLVVGLLGLYLFREQHMLSPLGQKIWGLDSPKKHYEVVGFLPTWMTAKAKLDVQVLDQLIFLGVGVSDQGHLDWDSQAKKIHSPEFKAMQTQMKHKGKKTILGIKLFEDTKIAKLMANPAAQDRLIQELEQVVAQEEFDGVNVDFEYMANPTGVLEEEFIAFLTKLNAAELGELSLDVFCNTILKGNWTNLAQAAEILDYIVIMAYDFHRPGVDYAGPVAPIRATGAERSILETLQAAHEIGLPKEKIIVAYPLYGYEWQTADCTYAAPVKKGWSAMASYGRMKEELVAEGLEPEWDSLALSPWLCREKEGQAYQVYFENLQSLSLKIKLVVESQMGGVGFWALGYEGDDGQEVWSEVTRWVE